MLSSQNCVSYRVEQRSPAIYIGGDQEFLSEVGLFRKLPGTEIFASRVKSGSTIELGENIQLRSIVRSGDGKFVLKVIFKKSCFIHHWIFQGWNYAKITDLVVHRVHDGKALTSPKDTAQLVGYFLTCNS